MTGAEPVTDRRGGDSRARRNAAEMNRQSLKRQTPPTCHCEGASCPWQSREGTCSPYRPPSKRHAPIASVAALTAQPLAALPPYGCGVPLAGTERLWQLQISGCSADRTRRCRGGACPARRCTNDSYRLSLKWQALPNCHCEAPTGPWQSRSTILDNK